MPKEDGRNKNTARSTYSHNSLGLELVVSGLAVGARHARNREDDQALIRSDTAGDVLEVKGEQVDGNEASILAVAAIEAVAHGLVHVRLGDQETVSRVHVCGVARARVRMVVVEVVEVVNCRVRAVGEVRDREVAVATEETVSLAKVVTETYRRNGT